MSVLNEWINIMLHSFSNEELRSNSKEIIESLELWLRRLIHDELTSNYGEKYFEHTNSDGSHLFKNEIIKKAKGRLESEPKRFSRFVDALLFEDVITTVIHPNLFNSCFKKALKTAYPNGNETARIFLMQLVPIRNKLYHANGIAIREAEKVLCYCHDAIESIKIYYKEKGMEKEYNVPTIIKMEDSVGNVFDTSEKKVNHSSNQSLYVEEMITLKATIDENFNEDDYTLRWSFENINSTKLKEINFNKITIKLENIHVNEKFYIYCEVKSNKPWHKCGTYDDFVAIQYKVLPIE